MKKVLKCLLLCLLLALVVCVSAACAKPRLNHEATPEEPSVVLTKVTVGDFTYQDMGDRLLVYTYNGSEAEVTVPASVEILQEGKTVTLPVTGIAPYAFYRCASLVRITLPSSVGTVGNDAFSGCSALQQVEGLGFVSSIGDRAFAECSSLQEITLPASVGTVARSLFFG